MHKIPFTQFLRPNGRRELIHMPTSDDELFAKANKIIEAGYEFQAEVLSDDITCSFTITHPEDGDVAIKLCANGPQTLAAVNDMITEFVIPEVQDVVSE